MKALNLAFTLILFAAPSKSEVCGDIQEDVETGMVRVPDFSGKVLKDLNCTWVYSAPSGLKLLVKIDNVHLPPSDLRNSSLHLYVDDQYIDIPRNCVKCLREMIGGKVVKILFFSSLSAPSYFDSKEEESMNLALSTEGPGSFQIRFKTFDPRRCDPPKSLENGLVLGTETLVGEEIVFHCNPPYDILGSATSRCIIPDGTPVPDWSNKAPRCTIKDCNKSPILRDAGSGAIASPGYPTYSYQSSLFCQWEITAALNKQIKSSLTYLKLPQTDAKSKDSAWLLLLDGDAKKVIINITESLEEEPLNFTTLSNKLIVQFFAASENKSKGLYLEYSTIPSSCPDPGPPVNGELIVYSLELASVIAFRCKPGYILVGEPHAECLPSGWWSNPKPRCELITVQSEVFFAASNDSDIVSENITELTPSKPPPKGRKKAKEGRHKPLVKASSETKEKYGVPNENIPRQPVATEADNVEIAKESKRKKPNILNGPKSQPHLQQIDPPKQKGTKDKEEQTHSVDGKDHSSNNSTNINIEVFPTIDAVGETRGRLNLSVTLIAIIAGIGAPLAVGFIILIALLIYRKRYPVRMRFGRKFSTFENPMYVRKDAHHPRELKRLTS